MIFSRRIIVVLLFFSTALSLSSLDLEAGFFIGNMGFNRDMNSNSTSLIWGFTAGAREKINDTFSVSGNIVRDDIMGHRMDSSLIFTSPYVLLSLGPSFATINNSSLEIKPALNGSVSIRKEGLISFTAEMYSTLGGLSDRDSDYTQTSGSLSLGFRIPGAICTFSAESRHYTRYSDSSSSSSSVTEDIQSTYMLEADMFKKNIPFNLLISLGYISTRRIFPSDDPDSRDNAGIGTIFIGAGTKVRIGKKINLKVLLDSSLYSFSLSDTLSASDIPVYLFRVQTVFTYSL